MAIVRAQSGRAVASVQAPVPLGLGAQDCDLRSAESDEISICVPPRGAHEAGTYRRLKPERVLTRESKFARAP